jgi:hypothetical protein
MSRTKPYMKHPAEILLRALLLGRDLQMGAFLYRLEDGHLYIVGRRISSRGEESEQLLGTSLTLDEFVRFAESMPEDEIMGVGMDNALTQEMMTRVNARRAYMRKEA